MKRFNKVAVNQGKQLKIKLSDGGSHISEGAKDIGKNITEVAKKLAETIDKKTTRFSK
jgi:hypothetical protein